LSQLKVALVVHNQASKDITHDEAYKARFGVSNPNTALVEALLDANVDIIYCGQSSLTRNFPKEDLIPGVKIALSAMTALIQYQNEGYRLIKFYTNTYEKSYCTYISIFQSGDQCTRSRSWQRHLQD